MFFETEEFDEAEAERCRLRKQRRDGELAKQKEIEQRQREEREDWERKINEGERDESR